MPIQPGTKMPIGDDWNAKRYNHPDIEQAFADKQNIGLMLGDPSNGLVDIDLDCEEAKELAPHYLPPTPAITGRGKNAASHYWYIAPGLRTRQHRDKGTRASIVELRSTGGQTLVGPSVHPDNDLYDELTQEPATVSAPMLDACVQALADAVMAKRYGDNWRAKLERPSALAPKTTNQPTDESKVIDRAIKYTNAMPGAVSGSGGHTATYTVATTLVHGFALDQSTALNIINDHHNPKCDPPWSQRELEHKIAQASNATNHGKPRGHLRDAVKEREIVHSNVDLSDFYARTGIDEDLNNEESTPECYQPFPTDTLPEPIRSYVESAAESVGCDPSYVALPMLSALAAAIGNTRRIRLKRTWTEPPIIWSGIVGESGTMKSPAISLAIFATQQRQKQSMLDYQVKKAAWVIEREMYDSKMVEWKRLAGKGKADAEDRPEEPEKPICERTWMDDTTIEALVPKLNENPRGLLLIRDELAGWLGSMDKYSGGSGGDSASWLEVFGGRSITVDRITRSTLFVESASVSICGGIQPGIIKKSMDKKLRDSGMLARFLIANPPRQAKQWREEDVPEDIQEQVAEVFDGLFALKMGSAGDGQPTPSLIWLEGDAKKRFVEFVNQHGKEQLDTNGDLAAAYSKLECYCARFALIFHMINESTGQMGDGRISAQCIEDAIRLVSWFTAETRRFYSWMGNDVDDSTVRHRELIDLIIENNGQISVRELQRKQQSKYPKSCDAKAALDSLVDGKLGEFVYSPIKSKGGKQPCHFKLFK